MVALGAHAFFPHKQIDFVTTHALCNECFRQIRQRRAVGVIAEKLCFALIIIAIFLLVPMLIFTPFALFPHPTGRAIAIVSMGLVIGLGGVVAGISSSD